MSASRIAVWIALIAGVSLLAPAAGAQEDTLEPGMSVVARSPGFVLRDGVNVIPVASPYDCFRVEKVESDRVRLYAGGREGEAG